MSKTKIKNLNKTLQKALAFLQIGKAALASALGGGPSTACPGPPELELAEESLKISSVRHYSYTKTLRPVAMIRVHQQTQAKLGYIVSQFREPEEI